MNEKKDITEALILDLFHWNLLHFPTEMSIKHNHRLNLTALISVLIFMWINLKILPLICNVTFPPFFFFLPYLFIKYFSTSVLSKKLMLSLFKHWFTVSVISIISPIVFRVVFKSFLYKMVQTLSLLIINIWCSSLSAWKPYNSPLLICLCVSWEENLSQWKQVMINSPKKSGFPYVFESVVILQIIFSL